MSYRKTKKGFDDRDSEKSEEEYSVLPENTTEAKDK
jgi:IMP cyclohydrolase